MEASGSKIDTVMQATKIQMDKLEALRKSMGATRRGGTVSIAGVYVGLEQNFPLGDLFDKQIQVRMGQANVRRWTDEILPLLDDTDPLGVDDLATHFLPLDEAPRAYEMFQKKRDGAIKVVLQP
jgi:threonine dehydrogenase-like Zn-dependent dehydrogenase